MPKINETNEFYIYPGMHRIVLLQQDVLFINYKFMNNGLQ